MPAPSAPGSHATACSADVKYEILQAASPTCNRSQNHDFGCCTRAVHPVGGAFFCAGDVLGPTSNIRVGGETSMRLMTAFWKLKRKRGTTMSDPCKLSVIRDLLDMVPDRLQRPLLADIGALIALADSWDDLISGARREANRRVLADPTDPLADGWVKFVGLLNIVAQGGEAVADLEEWANAERHGSSS
ncbi:MAG: hypothetical protein JWM72_1341 [Actinomycetia bacterium]|nr:hypothetical protein [Actinomycetes bacterium]